MSAGHNLTAEEVVQYHSQRKIVYHCFNNNDSKWSYNSCDRCRSRGLKSPAAQEIENGKKLEAMMTRMILQT